MGEILWAGGPCVSRISGRQLEAMLEVFDDQPDGLREALTELHHRKSLEYVLARLNDHWNQPALKAGGAECIVNFMANRIGFLVPQQRATRLDRPGPAPIQDGGQRRNPGRD